jgi:hypothetical protein
MRPINGVASGLRRAQLTSIVDGLAKFKNGMDCKSISANDRVGLTQDQLDAARDYADRGDCPELYSYLSRAVVRDGALGPIADESAPTQSALRCVGGAEA